MRSRRCAHLIPLACALACSGAEPDVLARDAGGRDVGETGDGGTAEPDGPGGDAPAAPLAVCGDGRDNDGDGRVDTEDPGCESAADPDERNPITGSCGPTVPYLEIVPGGDVPGVLTAAGEFRGGCGGRAGEAVFLLAVSEPGPYLLTTADPATADRAAAVYLRSACRDPASEIACGEGEVEADLPAGEYFVFVDALGVSDVGPFVLRVRALLGAGAACRPDDPAERCGAGLACLAGDAGTVCRRHACADGEDNDGDGRVDFPADPGCAAGDDDDESDPACDDLRDNDGDGRVDFGPDPGCADAADDDETDPATPPGCADGLDNNGNGLIDYPDDPACESAADLDEQSDCAPGVPLHVLNRDDDGVVAGTTADATHRSAPWCGFAGTAPERVFLLDLPGGAQSVVMSLGGSDYDTVAYARHGTCLDGAPLGCNDDSPEFGLDSVLRLSAVPPGPLFLFVDGYGAASGRFLLEVDVTLAVHAPCDPTSTWLTCPAFSVCEPAAPGAAPTCRSGFACGNGEDDDGDGLADHPRDPGCSSDVDPDETDPVPPPACADGADRDGDGHADWPDDPGCASAADDDERPDTCGPRAIRDMSDQPDGVITGDTGASFHGDTPPAACGLSSAAPDVMAALELPVPVRVLTAATAGSAFDTILYARVGACTGPIVDCSDDAGGPQSRLLLRDLPAGPVFFTVDGGLDASGAFTLSVTGQLSALAPCSPAHPYLACPGHTVCLESAPGAGDFTCRLTACSDGDDGDDDGLTDWPADPGCASPSDQSERSACSDGEDDDEDLRADYPADPGCAWPSGDSEADPDPLPACADPEDADGDGLGAWPDDPGCSYAADDDETDACGDGVPYPDLTLARRATGDTAGGPDLSEPLACAAGSTAPDAVFLYRSPSPRTLRFAVAGGEGFTPLLFVHEAICGLPDAEVACATGEAEAVVPGGRGDYYVFVSGVDDGAGEFTLTVVEEP